MLTINPTEHSLFKLFHKPIDEKRMVVILPDQHYDDLAQRPLRTKIELATTISAQALVAKLAIAPSQTSMF